MAKGQKRSNKEAKKPKQDKPKHRPAEASPLSATAMVASERKRAKK
jgi:hypothetical protein